MSGFCPHDWHGTTEDDLQHMALGGGDYEYAVWEASRSSDSAFRALGRKQEALAKKAFALAEARGIKIPFEKPGQLEALMMEIDPTW